ncbi:hypothetical protein ACVIWU_005784 [Bradyrhizobium sp. USDA 4509]|nr:hypothetical protein [Bradyrhizobium elkanii]
MLTAGPIRAGTRLREDRVMFGAEATHELEVVTVHVQRQARHDADLSQPSGDGAGTGTAAAHGAAMRVSLRDELERNADFAATIDRHVAV